MMLRVVGDNELIRVIENDVEVDSDAEKDG